MIEEKITKKKLREFGILIALIFPLLIGWVIPILGGHLFRYWTLSIALPSLFLAIFNPNTLFLPYKGWMNLGLMLGWINSNLILGLVFFMVLLPIALIMKIFKYDPLKLKINQQYISYRENNNQKNIDLTRIF